jgi:malate synthase
VVEKQLMAVPSEKIVNRPVQVHAPIAGYADILSPEALAFLARLHRFAEPRRQQLLQARRERQARYDAGVLPDFRPDTRDIREGDWTVAPIPAALQDRRVEITGPVERKMIINALNCGAKVFMADFEDSSAPSFANQLDGQVNLRGAVNGTLEYRSPEGKDYRIGAHPAVLVIRPRGWHLPERHIAVDGETVAGALVDFGLFAFHNARTLHAHDRGPYFYLPKLEAMEEAALWDEVMALAEDELDLPYGTMKATVLIETLPAVFQMHEILHALRERVVGLNCGRWDYIFSYLKTFRGHRDRLLPERGQVVMTVPFLKAYSELLIQTCHRRGAFAMGGMAAQIPIKNDDEANDQAMAKVRADKLREVKDGHDGTWVAHPGLVPVAQEVFDALMPASNQIDRQRNDVSVTAEDLLAVPEGPITEAGLRTNVSVGVQYVEAWLGGLAAVPLYNLMEDAATAEISRAQIWLWIHRPAGVLTDGRKVTVDLFRAVLAEELAALERQMGADAYAARHFEEARTIFDQLVTAPDLADFLTIPAYARIA